MGNVLAIAESLLIDRILKSGVALTGKSKAESTLFTLAGGLLVIALGFFITGAYIWVSNNYPPYMAATIAGVFVFSLSILCLAIAFGVMKYRQMYMMRMKHEISVTMQQALELAEDELGQPIRENPKTTMLVASLAGFIAGEKFI